MGKLMIFFWVFSIHLCLGQANKVITESQTTKSSGIISSNQDTISKHEKKVEFNPVSISNSVYKSPKLLKSKNRSAGSFFKNTAYYMKANLNTSNGKVGALKLMVSYKYLLKVTRDAKVKIEIRKVNYTWSDTAKVLTTLNEAQLDIYNKIPEKSKASVGEVVLEKYIPINEIKSDFIEISIESINEDEVFIAVGLDLKGEMNEGTRSIFRVQEINSFDMAYENGAFNYPKSYLDAKYLFREYEYFRVPYFELIVKQ
jgi:hypothetical protein